MVNEQFEPSELIMRIRSFLSEHLDGALATCMNNIPRSSPVQYYLGEDLNLYILSAGGDKFNAIESNPNVCLLVNTEYITYRRIKGVQIFGKATTSNQDSDLFSEAKGFAPDPYLIDREQNNLKVIKIVPDEIVYLDALRKADRTKQILNLKENRVTVKQDNTIRENETDIGYKTIF
jgi:uncharacterized protein